MKLYIVDLNLTNILEYSVAEYQVEVAANSATQAEEMAEDHFKGQGKVQILGTSMKSYFNIPGVITVGSR